MVGAGFLGLIASLFAPAAPSPAARFALVVAENRPFEGALEPLRFADDDGLLHAELLRRVGAEVVLLAVLDDPTQRRHPLAAAHTRPPTRAALAEAMADLRLRMQGARAAGRTVDFHFVFAGHGEVGANGEGRMHLRDGVMTRAELIQEVIAASPADFNHVLIDACHAGSLVFRRGADDGFLAEDYREAIDHYLDREDLGAFPNTGVLLASTASRESHEWDVFEAGVFSHEVRSGLTGVADTNGDGAVEYSELAAYVASANQSIPDPAARPEVMVRAPERDRHRPLVRLADAPGPVLRLPAGFSGRAFLEDARGARYADFHASGEVALQFALVASPHYFLRRAGEEVLIAPVEGLIAPAPLEWRERAVASRGAVDDAFQRHLFGVPFGPGFYAGYVAATGELPAVAQQHPAALETAQVEAESDFGAWPWVAGGAAVVLAGGAAYAGLSAESHMNDFRTQLDQTGRDDRALRSQIDTERTWAYGLGGAAVVAASTAVTLWLLDGGVSF